MAQPKQSGSKQRQIGKTDQPRRQSEQPSSRNGPDNPSKHGPEEPVDQEPHRESGSGHHEPHP